MHRLLYTAAHRALALPTPRAALTGSLLGALVWAMAQARPGDRFSLAMAVVLLLSGATSFVFHALSRQPQARRSVPTWLACLAVGALASMAALNLL